MDVMTGWQRFLLFLPIPGALGFGLGPLLLPVQMARALGYSGDDPYLTRLAGAATLGYGIALLYGVARGNWREVRLVVVALLVYSLAALLCCALAPGDGSAQPVVALIVANSILELAVCGWLLFRRRDMAPGRPNIPSSGVALVIIAVAAALVTGLPALLLPQAIGHLLGYHVTDVIILRLAGAATIGYAVMGALELRSRDWAEMRLPVLMAMVFNGAGLLATIASFIEGGPILLPVVVLLATLIVTPGAAIAIRRFGLARGVNLAASGQAATS
jgi:hypothetical protein